MQAGQVEETVRVEADAAFGADGSTGSDSASGAMKKVAVVLMLGLLFPESSRGAFEQKPAGARNAAMGGLSVAGGSDGWTANPALLLRATSTLTGVSLTPGLFNLPELSLVQAIVVVPFEDAAVGASFARFGGSLYRETEGALSFALGLAGMAAVGATARFFHLSIAGYGTASAGAVDIGMTARPAPAFIFSLAFTNCTGSSIGACREELPRTLGAAIEWSVEGSLCLVLELRKQSGFPTTLAWGGELSLVRNLSVRVGGTTDYPGFHAGAGVAWEPIHLDYAWRWHSSLGGTHTLSLTIEGLL